MKIYNKIQGLLLIAALVCGCNKSSIPEGPDDNEITIELDKSYIQFNSGIETKGTLVDGYLNSSFAVLGYQYPGQWEGEHVFAEPNVFKTENSGDWAVPQIVTYDDATQLYTYNPVQAWTGNRYSFFAYYPHDNANIKLFDDGTVKLGVPYITYTHPTDGDPTKLVDVMTASFIDTKIGYDENGNEINYEVNLEMQHRMSAIDICARNYYKDETGIPLTIEITSLEFNPIVPYKSAKFYLDGTTEVIPLAAGETGNLTYSLVKEGVSNVATSWMLSTIDIIKNDSEDTDLRYITSSKSVKDDDGNITSYPTTILLIPHPLSPVQQDLKQIPLTGTLVLSYRMKYDDGTYVMNGDKPAIKTVNQDLSVYNRVLMEARRYYIEITFTSDAVTVNLTAADEWDLPDKVEMEFE